MLKYIQLLTYMRLALYSGTHKIVGSILHWSINRISQPTFKNIKHIKSLQITKTQDELKETTNRSRKAQVAATSRQMKYPLVNVYITENHNNG